MKIMKTSSRNFIESVLSYGMIAGMLIIIVRAAVYLFDIDQTNVSFSFVNFAYNIVVLAACLYIGTVTYRKRTTTGNLTYGKGLLTGITISFVTITLIYVYDLIFHFFIAPDYLADIIETQLAPIVNNPSIPPAQKLDIIGKIEKYSSPFYNTSMNALVSFGISVIIALITAIFTVRKRPVIIEETN